MDLPKDFPAIEAYTLLRLKNDPSLMLKLKDDQLEQLKMLMFEAWRHDVAKCYEHIQQGGRWAVASDFIHYKGRLDSMVDYGFDPKMAGRNDKLSDPTKSFFMVEKPGVLLEADPANLKLLVIPDRNNHYPRTYDKQIEAATRLNIPVHIELYS